MGKNKELYELERENFDDREYVKVFKRKQRIQSVVNFFGSRGFICGTTFIAMFLATNFPDKEVLIGVSYLSLCAVFIYCGSRIGTNV